MDLERMQSTINSDLPDGYKLAKTGGENNIFPPAVNFGEVEIDIDFQRDYFSKKSKLKFTFTEKGFKSLN